MRIPDGSNPASSLASPADLSHAGHMSDQHANSPALALHFLSTPTTLPAIEQEATALGLPDGLARQRIAHRYGFLTWRQLETHVDQPVPAEEADFLHLACLNYHHDRPVFRRRAREMLLSDPSLAVRDVWHAACVGETDEMERILDADPSLIEARGGWFDWEPLLYAAYSRLDLPDRSTLATARLLVERGATPNAFYMWGGDCRFTALTGAFGEGEQGPANQPPHPEWKEFARLLLDAGADPNDGQALYNRMFSRDDRCLEMLLEYGLNCEHRINWRSGKGRVLDYQLDWAIRNHHEAREKLLVENGAREPGRSGT